MMASQVGWGLTVSSSWPQEAGAQGMLSCSAGSLPILHGSFTSGQLTRARRTSRCSDLLLVKMAGDCSAYWLPVRAMGVYSGSLQICSLGHIKIHMWQCVQGES